MITSLIVKGLPRLALVHVLVFFGLFMAGTLAVASRELVLSTVSVSRISFKAATTIATITHPALLGAAIASILANLVYITRKAFSRLWALPAAFILSAASLFGLSLLINLVVSLVPPALGDLGSPPASPLDRNGLVRYSSSETLVLLWPKAVVRIPDEAAESTMSLSSSVNLESTLILDNPFETSLNVPAFLSAVINDLKALSMVFTEAAAGGILPTLAISVALVGFFLILAPFAAMTRWPLANAVFCVAGARWLISGILFLSAAPIKQLVLDLGFIAPEYVVSVVLGIVSLALLILGGLYQILTLEKAA